MGTDIEIFIRHEACLDPVRHRLSEDATIEALKIHLAGSGDIVGVFIFEEDADDPLPDHHQPGRHSRHGGHGHQVLHHSKCRHVHAVVRYAGRPIERAFGPGSTLTRIKDWAEREFGIDVIDAAELSLQIAGTIDRPDGSTHVGSLAKCPDCRVIFDLLPTVRVNGSEE